MLNLFRPAAITATLLLCAVFCEAQSKTDCKNFIVKTSKDPKTGPWKIVYNKFYKKYAVMRIDSFLIGTEHEQEFLVKNHSGDYGVYSAGWETKHCYSCGDVSKSLFNTPCEAKEYLLIFVRKLKYDKWE